jgi:uncharacterized protein (DUF2252 family)
MMVRPDPIELGRRQLARDRERKVIVPGLMERKIAKIAASPLAFLRGAAPLFYELLAEYPELAHGPDDAGHLCGDAHVENFGVYRTARVKGKDAAAASDAAAVVFDLNDFDETVVGPFRLDVLRLTTSVVLAGREFGAAGTRVVALCRALLSDYVGAAFEDRPQLAPPPPVARLLAKVENRSPRDMLDRRTRGTGKDRRFVLGERYLALPEGVAAAARDAFARYVRSAGQPEQFAEHCEVLDLAFRVAGTGSIGSLRVAVLTRGKGGTDGGWLFDMKEEGPPAAEALLGKVSLHPAERVLSGASACLAQPPRMMGTTELAGTPMFVRRLAPQEDKLDLTKIAPGDLEGLAAFLGARLGAAHRRGATAAGTKPWSASVQSELVDRAITIAGIHEASYLALCKQLSR